MDFTFSEEQRMMAAALRELTTDLCSSAALRAVFDGDHSSAEVRWQRLAELGLFGVLAPPGAGGMGLSDADFVLLAEEAGRAALPEPLAEQAALAVPLLAEVATEALAAALLPRLASGAGTGGRRTYPESLCERAARSHALGPVFSRRSDAGERRGG